MNELNEILADLKKRKGIIGLKAEFETEGAEYEEICALKKLAIENALTLEIKIGGCGAIRDLYQCKKINADKIVAPMIESEYALKKFISGVQSVYKNTQFPLLFINIETITGIKNINEILKSKYIEYIDGIILGRGDLAASMNIDNSSDSKIAEITELMFQKTRVYGKKLIIGGKIKPEEINLLVKCSDNIETRKIVFNSNVSADDILRAIEFEIIWIEKKSNKTICDYERINELTNRLKTKEQIQNAV